MDLDFSQVTQEMIDYSIDRAKSIDNKIKAETDLKNFLADRESDIAYGIDDFAELESVFILIFNRSPEK